MEDHLDMTQPQPGPCLGLAWEDQPEKQPEEQPEKQPEDQN
jgi:hypothetical protein